MDLSKMTTKQLQDELESREYAQLIDSYTMEMSEDIHLIVEYYQHKGSTEKFTTYTLKMSSQTTDMRIRFPSNKMSASNLQKMVDGLKLKEAQNEMNKTP